MLTFNDATISFETFSLSLSRKRMTSPHVHYNVSNRLSELVNFRGIVLVKFQCYMVKMKY